MAKQTFVADAILTAAQMNSLQGNDFNQTVSTKTASYVLVAADAGTKIVMNSASATTITVNTSLFAAGDNVTILNISSGVCTVTAGTATVSTAGTLALVANAGGTLYFTSAGVSVFQADGVAASAGGLTLINTTTFVGQSSQSVNNCFSATYANYLILFSNIVANNSTPRELTFRLRVGGVDNSTASSYSTQRVGAHSTSTAYAELLQQSQMLLEQISNSRQTNATVTLTNPFTTDKTGLDVKANGFRTTLNDITVYGLGEHTQAVSYDGFTLISASLTISGTIRVYGYAN
jgi:hypothetical protein